MPEESTENMDFEIINNKAISQPLVSHMYTADPSAHVFNGKIYIYPSHDIDAGIPFNDNGDHFGMEDYHVISMEAIDSPAVDNGLALHVNDVPWAERQMWAPDAAHKNGKYYLYFPAKRGDGIFQIGVAIGDTPAGPFLAEKEAIKGSYTIDPAVFEDEDGKYYMYFGGIWGGQLQKYRNNTYDEANEEPTADQASLGPIIAMLSEDMKEFAEVPKEIQILDENGAVLLAGDNSRRFFEAAWVHKYNGKYYFSYSTGDSHYICYATGDSPYGPFTYQGVILEPVVGWTSHHSICEVNGKWYLFYHDSSLSKGITHLRSIKVTEIEYNEDGTIVTIQPYLI
ncbi:glycoside hydrolase family 43 protein [Flavobacterium cellulosilyticum]|uniref:Alpha-N-arabinofuranosidase n=1 Tax=Flavobacterium cellulosilyticum TaxID=2541731 RepID=A0A4R5CHB2_9FLAO|nr:glycoside hydrolase family 43 protein [Flavobacterium cellulosilyticum]TDD99511.1 alpha-N-arabinofuranosidase [Flavobacterium cellulosilyticum]